MKKFILFISCLILIYPTTSYSNESSVAIFSNSTFSLNHEQLSVEQAKQLLLRFNNKVNYIYQGDARQFEYLKSKNLDGYVFLPNVDTDIGYFVNKNNGYIYYFHPSGYLKLAQKQKR